MPPTLAVAALVQLFASASFAYVGGELRRRGGWGPGGANASFAAWWWSMSLYMLMHGLLGLFASVGVVSLPAFLAVRAVDSVLLPVAAWGITYYVLYLYSGRRGLGVVAAAYYAGIAVAFAWLSFFPPPAGVNVQPWGAGLAPEPSGFRLLYALFGLPPILATVAYLSLIPRIDSPLKRYRVALLGGAILAWVVSGLAAQVGSDPFLKWFTVTVLGLVTALATLLAFRPPAAALARLDPLGADAEALRQRKAARVERMMSRISELV